MNAENFEDLAQQYVMSGFKHRMLYVFVRVGAINPEDTEGTSDEDAMMVQVLFDAHQPAVHGMSFSSLREVADAQSPEWNMVVVGVTKNDDASLPSEEQAQSFLADMREKIMVGAIDEYALLDRNGNQVEVETDVDPISTSTQIN